MKRSRTSRSTARQDSRRTARRAPRRATRAAVAGAAVLLAGTSLALTTGVQPAYGSATPAMAPGGELSPTTVTEYVNAAIVDADAMWSTWMTGRGYPEPYVQYDLIQAGQSKTYAPACASPDRRNQNIPTATFDSDFPNAFYCPSAVNERGGYGVIILPAGTLTQVWTGNIFGKPSAEPGDFAVATIVAHEFGHHIAQQLAWDTASTVPAGKDNELLADCFAGVWTTQVFQEGALEDGDVEEGLAALAQMGDQPTVDGSAPKSPHGTAAERETAFRIGIYGTTANPVPAVPGNCLGAYWPGYTGRV